MGDRLTVGDRLMRILVRLSTRADTVYDNTYHRKLGGRIWQALEKTKFDDLHDKNRPKGFVYSNPFPPQDMREGDERTLLVASPHETLLAHIAEDLKNDPELNIGEMPFHVTDITALAPDVGEPGASGTISTGTGVLVRIPPWRFDDYNLDIKHDEAEFWKPEHTMEPFKTQIKANLDKKHRLFCADHLPGPSDQDGELFDSYELIKTFSIPVSPAEGIEETWVLSKWNFEYTVRDNNHRRWLNLALDVGIGERNSLGFGFVNLVDHAE